MITYTEENAVKLSATKKDFYQIWNELLETAGKISERWDPTSTNESDPGIVLLKVLASIADKLNYNIDMNALETFMPSAAQLESMRKLTEMLGYNMKYYQSATTDVKVSYNKVESTDMTNFDLYIDRFTNIKDLDDTINYVTLQAAHLTQDTTSVTIPCIEGELVECETENANVISLVQLDDNNRYYLPEVQIAENGIFVTNIVNQFEQTDWDKVDNLNTQPLNKKCWKFGFDSNANLPYVQFPEDISALIENGLKIKYIRTNGINGNISPKTLCKLTTPISWETATTTTNTDSQETTTEDCYNVDNYSVTNLSAAKNGTNLETITEAYNNYKKTIGTFDTLVTCRDYMNKIYQLTTDDTNTIHLVSNIIVSDIRDDINKAITLCTFGKYGIEYNKQAKAINLTVDGIVDEATFLTYNENPKIHFNKLYKVVNNNDSSIIYGYYRGIFDGNNYRFEKVSTEQLSNFDLIFYPFKNIYGLNTKLEYTKSFKYDDSNITEIKTALEENKTLAHNIRLPDLSDIACIKNYFNLNAKVTTNKKVNILEQQSILNNIYTKLYENFNMHKVDFGEEIPYDSILKVMETADPRIKNVSLEDPDIITKFCTVSGGEFSTDSNTVSEGTDPLKIAGNIYYNKLVLNNVLAGRIPLFNYNENFKPDYTELNYPSWGENEDDSYNLLYPAELTDQNGLSAIKTHFEIDHGASNVKLKPNEIIQFRLPNLKTTKTYPAYVNYYLNINNNATNTPAIPATMQTLLVFLTANNYAQWDSIVTNNSDLRGELTGISTDDQFTAAKAGHNSRLYYLNESTYTVTDARIDDVTTYYYLKTLDTNTFSTWEYYIQSVDSNQENPPESDRKLKGLYYILPPDLTKSFGKLVDKNHRRYLKAEAWRTTSKPFEDYCVQLTFQGDLVPSINTKVEDCHTANGLGQDAIFAGIQANEEYLLKAGEYLLINYTSGSSTEGNNRQTVINELIPEGKIIKPNFELINSKDYRITHAYNKTTGFDFSGVDIEQPAGMFTLGTNEQIELRDFVIVELDSVVNLYWIRNDEMTSADNRIYFNFNEENNTAYTLKEGEYIFYTNKDKNDLAYYGAGTRVKKTAYTPQIYKAANDANVSVEDILNSGLSTAIPWHTYDLGKTSTGNSRKLSLIEYQYKNLGEGATLIALGNTSQESNIIELDINSVAQPCSWAIWRTQDDAGIETLPKVNFNVDNAVSGNKLEWEVYSRLALNVSSKQSQQLYDEDKVRSFIDITDSKKEMRDLEETDWFRICAHNNETLSFKANKTIQSTTEITSVASKTLTDGEIETIYNCQLKIFKAQEVMDSDDNPLSINNFGEDFTKLTFENMVNEVDTVPYTTINATIPNDCFGVLMIQNNKLDTDIGAGNASIKFINTSDTSVTPVIYNYPNSNAETWWANYTASKANYAIEENSYPYECTETNKAFLDNLAANGLLYSRVDVNDSTPTEHVLYKKVKIKGQDMYYHYTNVNSTTVGNSYYKLIDVGTEAADRYYLRPGINIIKIEHSCKIAIFADQTKDDTLILSSLNIVYNDSPINPKLCYKSLAEHRTAMEQILLDINEVDKNHDFYYNAKIDNETSIDLNEKDPDDTLENPLNWFNYNNTANKFVIGEINADYLADHVVIAKNSKL